MTAGVVAELGALVDLLGAGWVPTPHGLHLTFNPVDVQWVRSIADDPAAAAKVGLRPQFVTGPTRTIGGIEGVDVRLSWLSDQSVPDRARMVAAVRAVTGLVLAAEMPAPTKVDAMHALTHVGLMAQRIVARAASTLDERPTVISGSVFVVKRLGGTVSYRVHGFLR